MTSPGLQPDDCPDLIAAFADGEVDPARHAEALRKLADDPQNADRVAFQAALRAKVAGCLDCTPCPEEVRTRIETAMRAELAKPTPDAVTEPPQAPSEPAESAAPAVAGRIGPSTRGFSPWVPAALAACLLVAAVGFFLSSPGGGGGGGAAGPLSSELLASFSREHVSCVQGERTPMDAEAFPASVEALPGTLAERFNRPRVPASFDLSPVGLRFVAAGACVLPAKGSVHLVYEDPQRAGRGVSVWLRVVDERSPELEEGRPYMASAGERASMVFWRTEGVDVFVVSERAEYAMDAARAVGMPSRVHEASYRPSVSGQPEPGPGLSPAWGPGDPAGSFSLPRAGSTITLSS